jgi:hypothetical protein
MDAHPLLVSGGALRICSFLRFDEGRPRLWVVAALGLDDFVRLRIQSIGFEKHLIISRDLIIACLSFFRITKRLAVHHAIPSAHFTCVAALQPTCVMPYFSAIGLETRLSVCWPNLGMTATPASQAVQCQASALFICDARTMKDFGSPCS